MIEKKPKIVCLCGSTKFYEDFMKANYEETMLGNIVLSVGFFMHSSEKTHGQHVGCSDEQKEMLDKLHLQKIDLAGEILVINKDGYIGESTRREIKHAVRTGKPVRWYFPEKIPEDWI